MRVIFTFLWLTTVAVTVCAQTPTPATVNTSPSVASGRYKIRLDQPKQIILGLGVEIQNDAIGSGNSGMPDKLESIPHDLIPTERTRLYNDLLKGFRYCRLAMGLYFRGLDAEKKRVVERYPNQLNDLKELIRESGMEGISMEYWSCAPYWKSTNDYIGGTLKQDDDAFLAEFGNALVDDIRYMQKAGITISMWGLQNEPGVKTVGTLKIGNAPKQSYSHCAYTPELYYKAFRVIAPKIRQAAPKTMLMVDSWDGNSGPIAKLIQQDRQLLPLVDAWVYHRIGSNSNRIMAESPMYQTNTFDKPVFQNEFEYQHPTHDTLCLNTAQNILNWFTFADSPTWFWLHALKPTYNAEASGYSLGFWRPEGDTDFAKNSQIKKGHWDYNNQNFNAIAGFLTYMPWNSRRYHVEEDVVRKDNRIMAFKTPEGRQVIVLTNRSGKPFQFHLETDSKKSFAGYRYTPSARNIALGKQRGASLSPQVPNLAIEFWVEE
jgi:O-glycosyl hydrolase